MFFNTNLNYYFAAVNNFNFKLEKERKLQIIKAAAKRFDKHGVNKTTLNEIARDLRIGKATIYGYFNSKEELFFSVLEWEGSQFLEEAQNIFNKEELQIRDRFLQYFDSKENISQRYKLMIDSFIKVLDEKGFDGELLFIKNLLTKEEELIKSVLLKANTNKNTSVEPSLPIFLALKSWGLYFGFKLHLLSTPGNNIDLKKNLLKEIDNLFL